MAEITRNPHWQCGGCKFISGAYKKDCSHCGKGGQQAHSAKEEEEGVTSWDKDKSTKKKDKDKGKGHDWSKSIQE